MPPISAGSIRRPSRACAPKHGPTPQNADELHDALVWLGFLTEAEVAARPRWSGWLTELAAAKRAGRLELPGATLWISAERAAQFRALWPRRKIKPKIGVPLSKEPRDWSRDEALVEIIRGRLEGRGRWRRPHSRRPLA